ncbi:hypothetical protein [Lysinibacillus xylanilyticus]|uniref:Uncharacterized protein n=1 Tax=Lysinibacillus xylanilyticus TaxID=582475 RepID=A0A2M9QA27_9BACI|nr:hypothetical protein [Lysinibacillus xylanilyticus]PJO44927.1 hypothetical protein CWD94_04375 [Lysinibacillus xylanilyticus]
MLILQINTERIAVVNFEHAIIYFEIEHSYCDSNKDWENIKIRKRFDELFDFLRKDGIDVNFI